MPGAATAAVVDSRQCKQHAEGPAAVLAIGTANPTNIVYQDGFADYYFGLTKSEHLTELKDKMKRICKHIDPSTSIVALFIIIISYFLSCYGKCLHNILYFCFVNIRQLN